MNDYHLMFWGSIKNGNLVEKELGITEDNFWFNTKAEREAFKKMLSDFADRKGRIVVFSEHEGENAKKRTVAKMKFKMPDGSVYPFEYDFGYGYEPESAHFMFHDGNYSCDCNRSIFLEEVHPEIKEMDCGDEIEMLDFEVVRV